MKMFSTALAAMISCFALAACGTTDNAAPTSTEDTGAIAADVSTADTNSTDAGNGSTDIACDTSADCPSSCFICQMSIDKAGAAQKKCVVNKKAINAACNDNDLCTTGETCDKAGTCSGTPTTCDDKNPCTSDACDPIKGCTHTAIQVVCDDGSACTTGDKCVSGKCAGDPVVCDDKNPCTTDSCELDSGCLYTNNTLGCDDGNVCTEGDYCSASVCTPGTAKMCNDNNGCTSDSCIAGVGCAFSPVKDGSNCSDGDATTTNDACQSGACVGKAFMNCSSDADCAAKIQTKCGTPTCTLDQALGPVTTTCVIIDLASYDDGNPCTLDGCSPTSGVFHNAMIGTGCDDNNACTESDSCSAGGLCTGNAKVCSDNNACTDDKCDSASGCAFVPTDPIKWSDKKWFTKDSCDALAGITNVPYGVSFEASEPLDYTLQYDPMGTVTWYTQFNSGWASLSQSGAKILVLAKDLCPAYTDAAASTPVKFTVDAISKTGTPKTSEPLGGGYIVVRDSDGNQLSTETLPATEYLSDGTTVPPDYTSNGLKTYCLGLMAGN